MKRELVMAVCRLESERAAISKIVRLLSQPGEKIVSVKIKCGDNEDGDIVKIPASGIDKLELSLRGMQARLENDLKNL